VCVCVCVYLFSIEFISNASHVQSVNLLCTKDTLSYYKSIKEGTVIGDEENQKENDPFVNYQVISCQNCDMTCALVSDNNNRYYLNANMLYGDVVEKLKKSEQYSKVFALLPQHTLDQEQNININIEAFPSLRKLQIQMQKILLTEKAAMEKRIADFAAQQRQEYMQLFKKTNADRTKVFLRAQHVIKYRRPDIQTVRDATQTPQSVSTPTDDRSSDNQAFSPTDKTKDMKEEHEKDLSEDLSDKEMHKQQNSNTEQMMAINIDSPNSPISNFKKNKSHMAQSFKELKNQSYFYRKNAKGNNNYSNPILFGFDEAVDQEPIDELSEETDEEEEQQPSELETEKKEEQQQEIPENLFKHALISHSRRQKQKQHDIYSSSVPISIPKRSQDFKLQQKQLKLQQELELESQKSKNNPKVLPATDSTQSNDQFNDSSDEDTEQPPFFASLAISKLRYNKKVPNRRTEDDIFDGPQQSYIERYETFKDEFFKRKMQQQQQQQQ
jgi:hypothetical protein